MTRESALARHDRMVLEEMAQAERVRSTADRPADFWQALAGRFRASADVRPDPAVDALAALIGPDDRVIDVGAGGGRHAIPLARRCRDVVAVKPSPAMRAITEELLAAVRQRPVVEVLVNFRAVRDLDPDALAPLLTLHRELSRAGVRLALCGLEDGVFQVFEAVRLDRVFRFEAQPPAEGE